MQKKILRGVTVAVCTVIMTTSIAFSNSLEVEAKTNPVGVMSMMNNSVQTVTEGDDAEWVSANGIELDTTPVAATNPTVDFGLNGIWTYVDNAENNPSPVLLDQESNTWVLAMYEGTTVTLGVTQSYGTGYTITPVAIASNVVAAVGNEAGLVIGAPMVGTDTIICQLCDAAGNPVIATQITIAINVVQAMPGTGNGLVTNDVLVGVTTSESTSTEATTQSDSQKVQEMLKLINKERAKLGRGALTINSELQAIAERRAVEIYSDFRHNGTGIIVSDIIGNSECITRYSGSITPSTALRNFKSSSAHWDLIMSSDCSIVGIGFYKNDCVVLPGAYVTQEELEEMNNWDW